MFMLQIENIFRLTGSTDEEKIILATYQIRREADDWWEVFKDVIEEDEVGGRWMQFRNVFLEKYV